MSQHGSLTWFFPDSAVPPAGEMEPRGHESLIMLNPNDADAEVVITVHFEDCEPDVLDPLVVGARRVRCISTGDPIDGYRIPLRRYALRLNSSVPLVCQIGRMDVRQPNLANCTVLGHPAD